jgi:7-cyano-7-deazaguanine synthase
MTNKNKKAVLLLSGGLDSTTVLEIAKADGFDMYALSFSYGQRHKIELEAVANIIKRSPVIEHKIIQLDLRAFGGSALTADIEVPKHDEYTPSNEIPVTYVPARNTIFLSFALGYAEVIGANDIFLGVNAIDYSNYPDCRPEFLEAFGKLANLATASGVKGNDIMIHAPLIKMTKAQIIQTGLRLGVDYSITNSCYDPTDKGESCGKCDACHLRLNGFKEAGVKDPTPYVKY